jgi:hypothetical protein
VSTYRIFCVKTSRIEARVLPLRPSRSVMVAGKAPSVPQAKHLARHRCAWAMSHPTTRGRNGVEGLDDGHRLHVTP